MATLTSTSRKKRAQLAQASQKLPPGHPELNELRAEFKTLRLSEYIETVLSEAPPLSDEQLTRLAELLRPARQPAGGASTIRGSQSGGGGDAA